MEIPSIKNNIVKMIDEYHENKPEDKRFHFGCSQVGRPCERELWLKFRWAVDESFNGRMKRLFRRGHNEEQTVISDLRSIGIDIRKTGDGQHSVDFGCHVSGSIDGIIVSGIPEAPNKKHILEIKTSSKKLFEEIEKSGVETAKPEHYIQMQLYMLGSKIDRALYIVICKDNDQMYIERVRFDKQFADIQLAKAKRISLNESMPIGISNNSTWYQCKLCSCHDFCHISKKTMNVNCRTCAHSTPKEDGTWFCTVHNSAVPNQEQINGCRSHVVHPDLVPWEIDYSKCTEVTAAYNVNGKTIMNGIDGMDSRTFLHSDNEIVMNVVNEFNGTVC